MMAEVLEGEGEEGSEGLFHAKLLQCQLHRDRNVFARPASNLFDNAIDFTATPSRSKNARNDRTPDILQI